MRRVFLALGLLLLLAAPTQASAVVQFKAQGFAATSSASISWTLTTGNAVGVTIFIQHSLFRTISSVSDGVNTWTPGCSQTGTNEDVYTYYAKNITGTSNPLVVTLDALATYEGVFAYEVSGADTTAPLDGNVCGTTTGTDLTSPALTTTTTGVVMTAGAMFDSSSTPWSAGTFYTKDTPEGFNQGGLFVAASESRVTAGAISATAQHITASIGTDGVIAVIAFKDASGGGGATTGCTAGRRTLMGAGCGD